MGRPWYKRFPSDFIAGTMQLTFEQKGAYAIVLDLIYDNDGRLPENDRWIAGVLGLSTRKWNQIKEALIEAGKLFRDDGYLRNKRADKQLENDETTRDKLRENGRKGGEKTQKKTNNPSNSGGENQAKASPNDQAPTQAYARVPEARSQILEPEESPPVVPPKGDPLKAIPKALDRRRGTRLAPDWTLPDEWRGEARQLIGGASVDIDNEAALFRDYWIAKAGKEAAKVDWRATWRNWIRRTVSQAGGQPSTQDDGMSLDEIREAARQRREGPEVLQ